MNSCKFLTSHTRQPVVPRVCDHIGSASIQTQEITLSKLQRLNSLLDSPELRRLSYECNARRKMYVYVI